MNRHLRNPRLLAGAAFVALLLLVALWPQALPVDVATVARGPLQVTVEEEGETRVRDRFVVAAPVSGRLLRIALEPGDEVRKDQAVLTLTPAEPTPLDARSRAEAEAAARAAQAASGRARAEKARAAATLAFTRSELQRHRELARQGVVASQQLEAAQVAEQQAREGQEAADFAAAAAEQELRRAEARLIPPGGGASGPRVTVRSPVDGVVLKRHRESETTVGAGEPLLELGDSRRLEIVSDLLSTDAVKVQAGARVLIEQWGGEQPLLGRVQRVEPSGFMKVSALGVEEQRVNVIIDFEDPAQAWEALGDGYRVEVRIVVWEAPDTLKVPTGSLFRRGSDWAVFTVVGGRARLRTVELGPRNGIEAQVLTGVGLGDRVVVHPSDTLSNGSRVAPRGAS